MWKVLPIAVFISIMHCSNPSSVNNPSQIEGKWESSFIDNTVYEADTCFLYYEFLPNGTCLSFNKERYRVSIDSAVMVDSAWGDGNYVFNQSTGLLTMATAYFNYNNLQIGEIEYDTLPDCKIINSKLYIGFSYVIKS